MKYFDAITFDRRLRALGKAKIDELVKLLDAQFGTDFANQDEIASMLDERNIDLAIADLYRWAPVESQFFIESSEAAMKRPRYFLGAEEPLRMSIVMDEEEGR
jgi:hypothetical protein